MIVGGLEWHLTSRLATLAALMCALDHREVVMDLAFASENAEQAVIALGERFGLDATSARVVMDMQVRRFAQYERERLYHEYDQLAAELESMP